MLSPGRLPFAYDVCIYVSYFVCIWGGIDRPILKNSKNLRPWRMAADKFAAKCG
jgi:hypothetical protein